MPTVDEQLATLAAHFTSRREAILQAWRSAVDRDAELTAPTSLPRLQFQDHMPELLAAFEERLRAGRRGDNATSAEERKENAAGHGLQRWQQGYRLREVTREWAHLHMSLVDELNRYFVAHTDLDPSVPAGAWKALAELLSQGVSESTTQYFELEQAEAVGHMRDLEQTLEEVRELEQRRVEMFRQAAHDLRGNVGVVRNVTTGLTHEALPPEMRNEFLTLLQRSVSSLNSMLDEVMDLARLQAGRELRNVQPFDAAALLRELYQKLQPLAGERGLFLLASGPESLLVEGDAVKIGRIVQNLLLNALKYTAQGGVTLHWGDSRNNDPKRWMLSIQDTGPGFHSGPGAPMIEALKDATAESGQERELPSEQPNSAPASADPRPVIQPRGEGIGLSIVKRLCELLDATIEVESQRNEGTLFRIVLPRHYNALEHKR